MPRTKKMNFAALKNKKQPSPEGEGLCAECVNCTKFVGDRAKKKGTVPQKLFGAHGARDDCLF